MQADDLFRVVLVFVGVVLVPKIHICFIEVVTLFDSGIVDVGVFTNLFCDARYVTGVFEFHNEMVMRLFEVAYLPIGAITVMVFTIIEKFLFGMSIFVMQRPYQSKTSKSVRLIFPKLERTSMSSV